MGTAKFSRDTDQNPPTNPSPPAINNNSSLTGLKGVSLYKNCGAASVGEYKRVI